MSGVTASASSASLPGPINSRGGQAQATGTSFSELNKLSSDERYLSGLSASKRAKVTGSLSAPAGSHISELESYSDIRYFFAERWEKPLKNFADRMEKARCITFPARVVAAVCARFVLFGVNVFRLGAVVGGAAIARTFGDREGAKAMLRATILDVRDMLMSVFSKLRKASKM